MSAWVYLKVPLGDKNGFSFSFYNGTTTASNSLLVRSTFGLNPDLINTWQQITIPVSAFQWSSQTFNKWVITMPNGASNGFKLDKIELQSGLQNIPPQTDYSRKQDSTTVLGAQVYWWENGIRHLAGTPTDTAFINSLIRDSLITVKNNYYTISQIDSITNTVNDNHYTTSQVDSIVNIINNNNYTSSQIDSITNIINSNHYTIAQVDSIVTVIRGEIVDASGGGVLSVAKGWGILQDGTITSTGTVTVDSAVIKEALQATFITNTDTTIQKKTDSLNVSLLNGGKIDTSHIPVTLIHAKYPAWAYGTDTIGIRNDSLPKLTYAPGVDTADYTNNALINKGYLNDRLAAFVTDGVTQQELSDTAAAISGRKQ
ncbi:MAG TPA: hypothetical protein VJ279_07665, partial [Hanamia sp.]|nr:hypothetical protein [Hanamia sp.]